MLGGLAYAQGDEPKDVAVGTLAPSTEAPSGDIIFVLPQDGVDLKKVEKSLLVQALRREGGNKTSAGKLLGLSRDQVRYRMERYGIE